MVPQTNSAAPDLRLESAHAAWVAGYETGKAERVEMAIEDQARAMLHAQALEMLGMAKRYADVKGLAWSAMVIEAAERE